MTRPSGSETTLARNWFAWWMLEQQLLIGGEKRLAEIGHKIGKTELSNIRSVRRGPTNCGPTVIAKLAPLLGLTEGRFYDEARSWWEHGGREIRARELARRAALPPDASDSGTMAAVQMPSSVPPGSRKAN